MCGRHLLERTAGELKQHVVGREQWYIVNSEGKIIVFYTTMAVELFKLGGQDLNKRKHINKMK